MNRAEFDRFADEYEALHAQNIAVTGETPDYFAEYKIRDVYNQVLKNQTKENLKILDFRMRGRQFSSVLASLLSLLLSCLCRRVAAQPRDRKSSVQRCGSLCAV